jgi:hypothetical protein
MAGQNDATGAVNPLDTGTDPNSIEASAADFDRMLEAETEPKGRSRRESEPEKSASRQADHAPKGAAGRDPVPDDEPRPDPEDDLFADPILGDAPPPKKGDDTEGEDDGTEGDDNAEGDEDNEGDAPEIDPEALMEHEFEVKVAGETLKVPFKELLSGYSREADYRQKTARLSEEQAEVEEFANTVVSQRKHYDAQLQSFTEMAKAFEPSQQEWDALKAQNPQLYIQTREQWDSMNKKVAEAQAERDRIAQEAAEQQTREYRQYVRSQNQKLVEAVPVLSDPKKASEFRGKLFSYGRKAGYTDEELRTGLVDHRDILTMYKAARYDEIVENRKNAGKPKGKGKGPRPSPSEQPRTIARRPGTNLTSLRKAERQLARTGSVEDAAGAFAEMIKSGRI